MSLDDLFDDVFVFVHQLGLFFEEQELVDHEAVVRVVDYLTQVTHDRTFIGRARVLVLTKSGLLQILVGFFEFV